MPTRYDKLTTYPHGSTELPVYFGDGSFIFPTHPFRHPAAGEALIQQLGVRTRPTMDRADPNVEMDGLWSLLPPARVGQSRRLRHAGASTNGVVSTDFLGASAVVLSGSTDNGSLQHLVLHYTPEQCRAPSHVLDQALTQFVRTHANVEILVLVADRPTMNNAFLFSRVATRLGLDQFRNVGPIMYKNVDAKEDMWHLGILADPDKSTCHFAVLTTGQRDQLPGAEDVEASLGDAASWTQVDAFRLEPGQRITSVQAPQRSVADNSAGRVLGTLPGTDGNPG